MTSAKWRQICLGLYVAMSTQASLLITAVKQQHLGRRRPLVRAQVQLSTLTSKIYQLMYFTNLLFGNMHHNQKI